MNFVLENINQYINESINIIEKPIPVVILFTDVVGSSNLWKSNESYMINALETQSRRMDKFTKKNKGMIIKTIGDAFMISFPTLENAIQCAIDTQKDLVSNPIKIGKSKLAIRIGIASGPAMKTITSIQGKKLDDYLGNTVNTASRIESKVSEEGHFAFAYLDDNEVDTDNIDDLLEKNDVKVTMISFSNKGDEVKRSGRVLTEVHRRIYKNVKELKGIDKVNVYNCKI